MHRAVERYQDTVLKNPYTSQAAYMEKATCSGRYCMYTEAMGYLYSFGYDYEIKTGNFVFLPDNMKKSDRQPSWLETMDYWYTDAPHIKHQSDFWPGTGSLFTSFRWFELNGPLGKPGSFTYEIIDTLKAQSPDISLIQMEFKPAGGRQDSGTIYIDCENFSIYRIKLDQTRFYSQNFRQWVSAKGDITYYNHSEGNDTSIESLHFTYMKNSLEYWVEFQSSPLKNFYNKVAENKSRALSLTTANPFVYYQPDVWPTSSPFSRLNMDSVRRDLEGERTLEEQFEANAGQAFFTITYQDERESTVLGGEETYELVKQILNRLESEFKHETNTNDD